MAMKAREKRVLFMIGRKANVERYGNLVYFLIQILLLVLRSKITEQFTFITGGMQTP